MAESDEYAYLETISPPVPTMEKYISTHVSDQTIYKTCWAHASTRIIIRSFYKILPQIFKIKKMSGPTTWCDALFNSRYYALDNYIDYSIIINFYNTCNACIYVNFLNVL